jgi:hypothetical protein
MAFLFPRNPRKSIYGGKYTKDHHYSSFVFPATCSPSFVIATRSPSFVIATRSPSFVIATRSPSFVITTMHAFHPTQIRSKVELLLSIFDPKGKLSTQDFHDAMTDDASEILQKGRSPFYTAQGMLSNSYQKQGEAIPAEKHVPILGKQESCTCGSMDDCCIPS